MSRTISCDLDDTQEACFDAIVAEFGTDDAATLHLLIDGPLASKQAQVDAKRLVALEAAMEANPEVAATVEAAVEAAASVPVELAALKGLTALKG